MKLYNFQYQAVGPETGPIRTHPDKICSAKAVKNQNLEWRTLNRPDFGFCSEWGTNHSKIESFFGQKKKIKKLELKKS